MTHGHLQADIDPLELDKIEHEMKVGHFKGVDESLKDILTIENYGFTQSDLDRTFHVDVPEAFKWGGII